MSVTPKELWKQSRQLYSAAAEEVQIRNVVGRAYYSAYHACRLFHEGLPSAGKLPARKMGVHAELFHRLGEPTIAQDDPRYVTSKVLALKLKTFHAMRIVADYRLDYELQRAVAGDALVKASAIFHLLDGDQQA